LSWRSNPVDDGGFDSFCIVGTSTIDALLNLRGGSTLAGNFQVRYTYQIGDDLDFFIGGIQEPVIETDTPFEQVREQILFPTLASNGKIKSEGTTPRWYTLTQPSQGEAGHLQSSVGYH
jgi:hypothetical protein